MFMFMIWCLGGAVFGYALGAVLADPEEALGELWDGIIQAITLPVRMVRRGQR